MAKEKVLQIKSFAFAIRIIKLSQYLKKEYKEFGVASQLLRSGTAIGALLREAEHAESRKDFIHKLSIALKEANECIYWLELIYAVVYITNQMFISLLNDCTELLKMLIASIKKLRNEQEEAE